MKNCERDQNRDRGHHTQCVGRRRIEHIDAFALQRRHNVFADYWNRGVEAVLKAGKAGFPTTGEDIFQHHPLVWGEFLVPSIFRPEQMKNVVFVREDQALFRDFFDLDVSANREIDHRGSDVAGMNTVIDQCSGLGGRNVWWGLVHRRNRHSGIRVAALVPPQRKHDCEGHKGQKDNRVAA